MDKNIRLADLADASKFMIGAFRSYVISGKPPPPEGITRGGERTHKHGSKVRVKIIILRAAVQN